MLLALLWWLAAVPAAAQSLSVFSGGGGGGEDKLIGRERVVENVYSSFTKALTRDIAAAAARAEANGVAFDGGGLLEEARRRYMNDIDRRLDRLESDGALTLAEVVEALPELRDRHLNRFEDVIEARSRGYPPPPLRANYDSGWRFARDMAYYTLVVRNGWQHWALLLLTVTAGMLLAVVLSKLVTHLAKRLDARRSAFAASVLEQVRVPLYLAAASAALLAGLDRLWLPAVAQKPLEATLTSLVVGLVFWAVWNLCDELTEALAGFLQHITGKSFHGQAELIMLRFLRVLVIVVFVLIVTKVVFDASITGMVAGLGIVGVGLWFLLRGLIENLSASFTLFGDRPFTIGDIVIYDGMWGTIEDIGFRSTRFRNFDGHVLTIPNTLLIDNAVHNVSARPSIRRRFRVGLVYGTPPDKMEQAVDIVSEILEERRDSQAQSEPPHVVFEAFGTYDLQLLIQYYYKEPDYWGALQFDDEVNREILRRFNDAGIEFAFPTQTSVLTTEQDSEPQLYLVDTSPDEASAARGKARAG